MARKSAKRAAQDAKFIFRGTIQKLKAATMAHVPADEDTVIVHVDEVLQAPPALSRTLGKAITVKMSGKSRFRAGQQLLFHANAWLFGEGVAVESVGEESVAPQSGLAVVAARGAAPTRNLAERETGERVQDADLIVQGQVVSVDVPQRLRESHQAAVRAAAGGDEAGGPAPTPDVRPVSEHDPKWRDAVIEIAAVHKGDHPNKTVTIRFPSSTDVRWYKAPKFRPGDKGVWILQKNATESVSSRASAAATREGKSVAPKTEEVFTALHPLDFHRANELDAVAPVLRAAVLKPV